MDIVEEIKRSFKSGTSLIKLIYINLAVFVVLKVFVLFAYLFGATNIQEIMLPYLAIPADAGTLLMRPWTLLSYMFLHTGFLHILFNMLWLWWFGQIFLRYLDQKKIVGVYILGGLMGAAFYVLSYNLFPGLRPAAAYSLALGASASVYAVVVATAVYMPNYSLNLMFIGKVRIIYIAAAVIIIDLISIPSSNAGGHIAHLGGALFGYLYILQLRKGKDMSKWVTKVLDSIFQLFSRKPKLHVSHKKNETDMEYNQRKNVEQKEIDKILEKIAKSGYESLSKKEKETLFKMSKKN